MRDGCGHKMAVFLWLWAAVFLWLWTIYRVGAQPGPVNIAVGLPASAYTQSSVFDWMPTQPSSCAANGNTSGDWSEDNCIHTDYHYVDQGQRHEDRSPWWQVDLGTKRYVYSIHIWARTGQIHRLYPFSITVDDQRCVTDYPLLSSEPRNLNITCMDPVYGQLVRLTRKHKQKPDYTLNMCELQVLVCNNGYYGLECDQRSSPQCSDGGCYVTNGTCIPCLNGRYGEDCRGQCGQCTDGAACDMVTGQCPLCQSGWYPPLCQQACQDGRFGENCTGRCSRCRDGVVCNKTSGHCPRCPVGRQPPLCDTDCQNATFGPGCTWQCGQCANGTACDPVTGHCPLCQQDYYPPYCLHQPDAKTEGVANLTIYLTVAAFVVGAGLAVVVAVTVTGIRRRRRRQIQYGADHLELVVRTAETESQGHPPTARAPAADEAEEVEANYSTVYDLDLDRANPQPGPSNPASGEMEQAGPSLRSMQDSDCSGQDYENFRGDGESVLDEVYENSGEGGMLRAAENYDQFTDQRDPVNIYSDVNIDRD